MNCANIILIFGVILVLLFLYKYFREYHHKNIVGIKKNLNSMGFAMLTFTVGNKKLNFLIDTGCNHSIIDSDVLNNLGINFDYLKIPDVSNIIMADGSRKTVKCSNLNLIFNGNTYNENFVIIDWKNTKEEMKKTYNVDIHGLLGISFFRKYKSVIDFKNYYITFEK